MANDNHREWVRTALGCRHTSLSHRTETGRRERRPAARGEAVPRDSAPTPQPSSASFADSIGSRSPEYQRGYQDGINGESSHPGPLAGAAEADYDAGYTAGRTVFERQNASLASTGDVSGGRSTPPASDAGAPDAGAPDAGAPDAGTPDAGTRDRGTSESLRPTGASPEESPECLSAGGLPAFRYNLPRIPIATAHIDTPQASIEITMSLRGSVTVTFPNAPRGVSTDLDTGGWRLEATQALGPLTQGLRVSGIGTDSPNIGVTMGTQYSTTEYRLVPPNTMVFIGQARVAYTVPSRRLGNIEVNGQPGYELSVTVYPRRSSSPEPVPVPVPIRVPVSPGEWFEEHSLQLAGIGAIALVAIAIAAAPETGGASLVLVAAL